MKKLVSLLLTVCMCLSVGAMLTACAEEHTHTYKTEWANDATHHWHECEGENCLEISDKAEHVWNEGSVTAEATADADGEKTYTCTVCNAAKSETFAFEGVREDQWQASIAEQKFDNVTINYTFENTDMTQTHIVKIADNKVYREMTVTVSGQDPMTMSQLFTGDDGISQKNMFLTMFLAFLAERDNYVYDKETGEYKSPDEVTVKVVPIGSENSYNIEVMTNGKVKFDANGNLEYFSCTIKDTVYKDEEPKSEVVGDVVWTFSDYGTTVLPETADSIA